MMVFQRLSTCPTVPELLSRDAERRASRWLRELPVEVWLRPSTAAAARSHLDALAFPAPDTSSLVQRVAVCGRAIGQRDHRPDAVPSGMAGKLADRTLAEARRRGMLRLDAWAYRRGMDICFGTATCVLVTTRAANGCGFPSPIGLEHGLRMADRLTRAGMRLWRSSRSPRRT